MSDLAHSCVRGLPPQGHAQAGQRMSALIAVGVFYSAIIYVLFMGFPVMNLSVGIAGGYVVGRRAALVPGSRSRTLHEAHLVARVASLMLFVPCCGTAWLALGEATIATEVQSMLGLPFTPSAAVICGLILGPVYELPPRPKVRVAPSGSATDDRITGFAFATRP